MTKPGRIIHAYKLRSVKFSEALSEETYAFSAVLCDFGGKKVADCSNHGHGGPTDVHFVSAEVGTEVSAYCLSLPAETVHFGSGDSMTSFEYGWDAERLVDDLFTRWLEQQDDKKYFAKIKRDAKTKLLVAYDDIDPSDPSSGYAFYPKCVYGQIFNRKSDGTPAPIQVIIRDRLTAQGHTDIRIYNPGTQEWEKE